MGRPKNKEPSGMLFNPNPSLASDLFADSAFRNDELYFHYFNMLVEIAVSRFQWFNLPDGCDERFMEIMLMSRGAITVFKDEVLEEFLSLPLSSWSDFNQYKLPQKWSAYGLNGYIRNDLSAENAVLIFNNYFMRPYEVNLRIYARTLANIDRTIELNINAQKTPLIIVVEDEKQRLTLSNLYKKYIGNEEVVFVDKSIGQDAIRVLKTDAPYLVDRLIEAKINEWNQALTFLGVANTMMQKKERLIRDEALFNMGGAFANRFSSLSARQQACKQMNKLWGLNTRCDFRSDETIPSKSEDNGVKRLGDGTIEGQSNLTDTNRQVPNEMRDEQ